MKNKALRILIADQQHFHRLKIERLFNHLDYYRVAPAQSLQELLTLVEYDGEPFDVVLVNAALPAGMLDLAGFVTDNPQVRHALIYNAPQPLSSTIPNSAQWTVRVVQDALPDLMAISQLMMLVDPVASGSEQQASSRWARRRVG